MNNRSPRTAIRVPSVAAAVAIVVLGAGSTRALAQAPALPERSNYSSLDAGRDAYQQHEARRMGQINDQIGLNQRMRMEGWISSYYPGVFQPWPMTPGYIWGYPLHLGPARQSVGQRQYQAGPNRWISEPVYPEDLARAQAAEAAAAANAAAGANPPAASNPPVAPNAVNQPQAQQPNAPAPTGLPPWLSPLLDPNVPPIPAPANHGPREF